MKYKIYSLFAIGIIALSSCKKILDVTPYAEFSPATVLSGEAGTRAVLFSSYANAQTGTPSRFVINVSEVCTDVGINSGGNENLALSQIQNFTWDATLGTFQIDVWDPSYRSIRDANLLLDNIGNAKMSDDKKKLYTAEAKFLRAAAYDLLFRWFGSVPLRVSSIAETDLERATDEVIKKFIEDEMLAAIPDLPNPGAEEAFGRANKGNAWSILTKFYLNTRQWQKAADAAQQVTSFNYYQLFPQYQDMFTVANERNREMIWITPCMNQAGFGNWYSAGALPPAFKSTPQIPSFTFLTSMANFATQYRMRSVFTSTFDIVNDKRAILLIRSYVNQGNANVNLLATPDNVRSLKYWDNGTIGNHSGNDVPLIRYADILLSRAEALNELNGPTQAALDLINLVRTRAGLADITLAVATSKEVLRDLILRERAWEFYSEGKRREDLLRHDRFISGAQARGIAAAAEKHKRFPIPQSELDANKACKPTDGY